MDPSCRSIFLACPWPVSFAFTLVSPLSPQALQLKHLWTSGREVSVSVSAMARVFPLVLRKSNPKNLGRLGTQGMLHGSMNIRYPKNYKLNKENHNPLDLRFFECPKCTSRCKHFTLHQGAPKIDSTAFTSTRHTSQVPGRCASRRFAPESCDVFPWNSPDGILWIYCGDLLSTISQNM